MMRYFLPAFIGILTLGIWEIWVTLANIPPFVLPAPTSIFDALLENANTLFSALKMTLYITTLAFFWAVISGIALAVIFTRARIIEMAFYPYVVTLQVTPVVAIAPLILIWVGFGNVDRALRFLRAIEMPQNFKSISNGFNRSARCLAGFGNCHNHLPQ